MSDDLKISFPLGKTVPSVLFISLSAVLTDHVIMQSRDTFEEEKNALTNVWLLREDNCPRAFSFPSCCCFITMATLRIRVELKFLFHLSLLVISEKTKTQPQHNVNAKPGIVLHEKKIY